MEFEIPALQKDAEGKLYGGFSTVSTSEVTRIMQSDGLCHGCTVNLTEEACARLMKKLKGKRLKVEVLPPEKEKDAPSQPSDTLTYKNLLDIIHKHKN